MKYQKSLTGIRGIAFLYVFLSHASKAFTDVPFSGIGQFGVWLFFVLSGYLLGKKLFIERLQGKIDIFKYLAKRFFRIYPLLILYILVDVAIRIFEGMPLLKAGLLSAGILSLQLNVEHLWTIPVEFRYYFVLPFIISLGFSFNFSKRFLTSISIVACLLYALGIQMNWVPGLRGYGLIYCNLSFLGYLLLFLSGTFVGILMTEDCRQTYLAPLKDRLEAICSSKLSYFWFLVIAFPFICPPKLLDSIDFHYLDAIGYNSFFYLPFCLLYPLLLAYIERENVVSRILSNNMLELIGRISYPAYLFHLLIIKFSLLNIFRNSFHEASLFLMSFLLTFGLSVILNIAIEEKFVFIGSSWLKRQPVKAQSTDT